MQPGQPHSSTADYDVIIVGAGFSGIYALHRLRALGFSVVVLEAASAAGGTWFWNRYPGARCDIQSMVYSYSFDARLEQDWQWSERFARQPEILQYINHVVERFDLTPDMQFNTRVEQAHYDEQEHHWLLVDGNAQQYRARFCIFATGCLSVPRLPAIDGIDQFKGNVYHTGEWPHAAVDFSGQQVAVIGTGSSGIQSIPVIAKQAEHVTVFQRTPNFSTPAWQVPLSADEEQQWKDNYPAIREIARQSQSGDIYEEASDSIFDHSDEVQQAELNRRWGQGAFNLQAAFADLVTDEKANQIAAGFVHDKIRGRVDDQNIAELLCPRDHPFGTKRLCVDTDYYETYNRDNVTLVDISDTPVSAITERGLKFENVEYQFDAIVFATGFDAMTGALKQVDIRGKDGQTLREKWAHGPITYLGLGVSGFPNLFTITGPGSPSVLTNMMVAIEQHVDWVVDCLCYLRASEISSIEASLEAESMWVQQVEAVARKTLYPQAGSWYMGANIPGKPRVFMPYIGGMASYRDICDAIVDKGYQGFILSQE
ncbi:MAG: cyclohexanone monooxygenase [Gammaproteobacteria bacterium]|jgi:cyclohexanone monooxygenase